MTDTPPTTGHRVIDAALLEAAAADHELTAAEHLERLSATQDVLAAVLESSREQTQAPIPGVR